MIKTNVWLVIDKDGKPMMAGSMLCVYSARERARDVARRFKGRAVKAVMATDGKSK